MVDLRTYKVIKSFVGAYVSDNLIKSCFSPDGRFVLSGSENGQICIWHTNTGLKQSDRLYQGMIRYGKALMGVGKNHLKLFLILLLNHLKLFLFNHQNYYYCLSKYFVFFNHLKLLLYCTALLLL